MTEVIIMWDVGDPLGASFEPKRSKIGPEMAELQLGGCVTQMSIKWDEGDPLGLHLNQKDPKSGQKWPSYSQFTHGRLRDSSEYYVGCRRSIRATFEPKRSKIGPEMAELQPFYTWEVA